MLGLLFQGTEIPDYFLLETLNKCLDEISQKLLQRKREENPSLKFSEFWGLLQEEFSSDSSHQQRKAWHQVKLDVSPPLTLEKWRKFQRDFELRKGRVLDWTEVEEYDLIYSQLPEEHQVKISREENKRRKDQFWVKLTNLVGVGADDIQEEFSEILGGRIGRVEEVPKGFLVECGSERIKRRFLGMDSMEVNGHALRVTRVEKKLRGVEIFDLVGEELKIRDEIKKKREESVPAMAPSVPMTRNEPASNSPKNFPFRPNKPETERVREVGVQPVSYASPPAPPMGGWGQAMETPQNWAFWDASPPTTQSAWSYPSYGVPYSSPPLF